MQRTRSWRMQRIMNEKDRFNGENQQATSVLIGDLNAAESEWLDTDRVGATHDSGRMEQDASVIAAIKDMMYSDLIRTRCPTKKVVTRAVQHDTNRLLDRVMVTKEIGKHQAAQRVWLCTNTVSSRQGQTT